MMNRFFTLLLAASCLTAVGQTEYCLDGTVWDEEQGGCVGLDLNSADINNDGCVQLNDLLDLLGAFGSCDQGIQGCTDSESPNFEEDATVDDGSCLPYLGMVALGGLVVDISNNHALVLNITEEITTGPLEQAAIDAANSLNTNGYSDWDIPYPHEFQDICPVVQYINLIINQNEGMPLDGRYVVDQCGANCNSPFTWLLARSIDSGGCGGYADALEFGDTFKLRAVRRHSLDQ